MLEIIRQYVGLVRQQVRDETFKTHDGCVIEDANVD